MLRWQPLISNTDFGNVVDHRDVLMFWIGDLVALFDLDNTITSSGSFLALGLAKSHQQDFLGLHFQIGSHPFVRLFGAGVHRQVKKEKVVGQIALVGKGQQTFAWIQQRCDR